MDLGLRVMIRPLRLRDFYHCDVKEAMDKIAGAPRFQRMRRKASPDKVAMEVRSAFVRLLNEMFYSGEYKKAFPKGNIVRL